MGCGICCQDKENSEANARDKSIQKKPDFVASQVKKPKKPWNKAVKESEVIGKTHGDTYTAYDDLETLKGHFGDTELPQVRAIEVHTDGRLCFGYQLFYQNDVELDLHLAQKNYNVNVERFELEQGEYLVKVGGRFGDICDALIFTTSEGRNFTAGGYGGEELTCETNVMESSEDDDEMKPAEKPYILALGAGLGGHIHHVKCAFLDLAKRPDLEAQLKN